MNIYDQLKRDEGIRLKPYRDSLSALTIGVGRNLDDVGISAEEADYLLRNDVRRAIDGLVSHGLGFPGSSDPQFFDARYWALVAMCFNLGITRLLKFERFLAAYRRGDWETVATEMLDSVWARQVGVRATRLAEQLRTGEWT